MEASGDDTAAGEAQVRSLALPRRRTACVVLALTRRPPQPAAEDALLLRCVDAPAVTRVTLSEKDKAQHVQLTNDGLGAQSSKARAVRWLPQATDDSQRRRTRGTAPRGARTAPPPAPGTSKCGLCTWAPRATRG